MRTPLPMKPNRNPIFLYLGAFLLTGLLGYLPWAYSGAETSSVGTTGPWGLKMDPQMGLVMANCGQCHTPYLITHHHRSREAWDRTITKMESNGLVLPPPAVRTLLLDYLERHQGPVANERPLDPPWGQAAFDANPLWE